MKLGFRQRWSVVRKESSFPLLDLIPRPGGDWPDWLAQYRNDRRLARAVVMFRAMPTWSRWPFRRREMGLGSSKISLDGVFENESDLANLQQILRIDRDQAPVNRGALPSVAEFARVTLCMPGNPRQQQLAIAVFKPDQSRPLFWALKVVGCCSLIVLGTSLLTVIRNSFFP
jgi:hypothetical protein